MCTETAVERTEGVRIANFLIQSLIFSLLHFLLGCELWCGIILPLVRQALLTNCECPPFVCVFVISLNVMDHNVCERWSIFRDTADSVALGVETLSVPLKEIQYARHEDLIAGAATMFA